MALVFVALTSVGAQQRKGGRQQPTVRPQPAPVMEFFDG